MKLPSPLDPLPPWAVGLPAAAAALRTLLIRVDGTMGALWSGVGLEAALLRYKTVVLPMYAAHLAAPGVISLTGTPGGAAAADGLVAAATAAASRKADTATAVVAERGWRESAEERAPWVALSAEAGGGGGRPAARPPPRRGLCVGAGAPRRRRLRRRLRDDVWGAPARGRGGDGRVGGGDRPRVGGQRDGAGGRHRPPAVVARNGRYPCPRAALPLPHPL